MARVLVACEFSGVVRDAFIRQGHDAVSCDLLDTEVEGPHIKGDVLKVLDGWWDMMIAHPPCTYLCSSGLHWNKRRPERQQKTEEALEFVEALLSAPIPLIALENPIGCISTRIRPYDQKIQPWQFGHDASKGTCLWLDGLPPLEPTDIFPPHQYRLVKFAMTLPLCDCCGEEAWCDQHETHFADCECIGPTQDGVEYKTVDKWLFGTKEALPIKPGWANQTPSGQNKLGPSANRWALRSITYAGIAEAMANQWGNLLTKKENHEYAT